MQKSYKEEILEAIAMFSAHVEVRLDGMEKRMDGMEGRVDELAKEMRSGFAGIHARIDPLEENIEAINKTLDKYLEGDVLGKDHITLTRPEYDTMTTTLHVPNRFETAGV